jgi:hypothetical protein
MLHNIKTAGGPMRSTKRKKSRETRFHGIKGAGAGEKVTMKIRVEDVWRKERVHVGWWNYDVHLSQAFMPRWDPKLCHEWKQAIKAGDAEYLKGTSGRDVWATGSHRVPRGVQTLNDRVHVAKTTMSRDAHQLAIEAAENHRARVSRDTKAYRDQIDAKRQADALSRQYRKAKEADYGNIPSVCKSRWDMLFNAGHSGLGLAKKKVA